MYNEQERQWVQYYQNGGMKKSKSTDYNGFEQEKTNINGQESTTLRTSAGNSATINENGKINRVNFDSGIIGAIASDYSHNLSYQTSQASENVKSKETALTNSLANLITKADGAGYTEGNINGISWHRNQNGTYTASIQDGKQYTFANSGKQSNISSTNKNTTDAITSNASLGIKGPMAGTDVNSKWEYSENTSTANSSEINKSHSNATNIAVGDSVQRSGSVGKNKTVNESNSSQLSEELKNSLNDVTQSSKAYKEAVIQKESFQEQEQMGDNEKFSKSRDAITSILQKALDEGGIDGLKQTMKNIEDPQKAEKLIQEQVMIKGAQQYEEFKKKTSENIDKDKEKIENSKSELKTVNSSNSQGKGQVDKYHKEYDKKVNEEGRDKVEITLKEVDTVKGLENKGKTLQDGSK